MNGIKHTVAILLLGISVAILASLVFALPLMLLWNHAVVHAVTFAKPISLWTAFLLTLFIAILKVDNQKETK